MGKASETRAEKQAPKDRLYGDVSPDDKKEPEADDRDANPDDFERGKSPPGARERHRKQEEKG